MPWVRAKWKSLIIHSNEQGHQRQRGVLSITWRELKWDAGLFHLFSSLEKRSGGKVGCVKMNSSKTLFADKVLPDPSHRLTPLWPWIINEQDRVVIIRRRLPVNDYWLHWVHWVHWVRICMEDENVKKGAAFRQQRSRLLSRQHLVMWLSSNTSPAGPAMRGRVGNQKTHETETPLNETSSIRCV